MRAAMWGLLLAHASLVAWTAWQCSAKRDEPAHLSAGISHWRFADFSLYRVNPPLARMTAAAPVLLAGVEEDWTPFSSRPLARAEFPVGRAFVAANGPRSIRLIFLARMACLPFSLIGACVCYRWASEINGAAAGLTALALWCFCPIVLGHAALVTPDVAAASLGAGACYLFGRWLNKPTWRAALVAGAALGLAELTKFTWLVLFVVWPLTAWICVWRSPRSCAAGWRARWVTPTLQIAVMLSLAAYAINLGYGFQGTGERLGDFRFVSRVFKGPFRDSDPEAYGRHNRFAGTWLESFPAPLPKDYLLGIDVQRRDFENCLPTYFRGAWREVAPWYAYFFGLAIKLPLGSLGLMGLAALPSVAGWRSGVANVNSLALLAPAAAVLGAACAHTGLDSQVRYVLPALPFIFIWTGKSAFASGWRCQPWLSGGLLLWSAAATLADHPHHLAYFNRLSAASAPAPPPLFDSNLDWGQDLLYLRDWLEAHPEVRPLRLAYYGSFDPADIGIESLPPTIVFRKPSGSKRPLPGWYAISLGKLWDQRDGFAYFRGLKPTVVVGRTIYLYKLASSSNIEPLPEMLESPTTNSGRRLSSSSCTR